MTDRILIIELMLRSLESLQFLEGLLNGLEIEF